MSEKTFNRQIATTPTGGYKCLDCGQYLKWGKVLDERMKIRIANEWSQPCGCSRQYSLPPDLVMVKYRYATTEKPETTKNNGGEKIRGSQREQLMSLAQEIHEILSRGAEE